MPRPSVSDSPQIDSSRVGPDDAKRVVVGLMRATIHVAAIGAGSIVVMVAVGQTFWLYEREPLAAYAWIGFAVLGLIWGFVRIGDKRQSPTPKNDDATLHDPPTSSPVHQGTFGQWILIRRPLLGFGAFRKALVVASLIALITLVGALVISLEPQPPPVVEDDSLETPDVAALDVPEWLEPLEPLARLPLWGQAAVLSAGVAGMFFVLPMVFKWVWKLGEDSHLNPNSKRDD